jgi:hypothetical protein
VWAQIQSYVVVNPQVKQRELRIQELEQDVERYRVELEEQSLLLPASATQSEVQS